MPVTVQYDGLGYYRILFPDGNVLHIRNGEPISALLKEIQRLGLFSPFLRILFLDNEVKGTLEYSVKNFEVTYSEVYQHDNLIKLPIREFIEVVRNYSFMTLEISEISVSEVAAKYGASLTYIDAKRVLSDWSPTEAMDKIEEYPQTYEGSIIKPTENAFILDFEIANGSIVRMLTDSEMDALSKKKADLIKLWGV